MNKERKYYGDWWENDTSGGLHPCDKKRLKRMWRRIRELGNDLPMTQQLGPECLLVGEEFGSSFQHLHTKGAFKKWKEDNESHIRF